VHNTKKCLNCGVDIKKYPCPKCGYKPPTAAEIAAENEAEGLVGEGFGDD
jgi:tRNA(Ile2) C34 agmatinyltransferase TiaS